ncbi:MAG TPA: DUF4159 domain-containing protein [Vicinamibacterales bacterium]|nr:DUF4159 domain-containing protein [Vicinamibacterales bacterium]
MPRRLPMTVIALVVALATAGAAAYAQDWFGRRRQPSSELYGNVEYDGRLTFVRIRFAVGYLGAMTRRGSRGELPWAHDYPTADIHMMKIMREISGANARVDGSNVFTTDEPDLFNFPIAYVSEPGFWQPNDAEVAGFRQYLLKGGFAIFDDFRGEDWDNLEQQMRRVLPELRFVALDEKHPIFNSFFEIRKFDFGYYGQEVYYGLFEENDPQKRLLAVAGLNQDLGEFWEFSDTGLVPIDLSNEAYKFGVNYFIYAMTH